MPELALAINHQQIPIDTIRTAIVKMNSQASFPKLSLSLFSSVEFLSFKVAVSVSSPLEYLIASSSSFASYPCQSLERISILSIGVAAIFYFLLESCEESTPHQNQNTNNRDNHDSGLTVHYSFSMIDHGIAKTPTKQSQNDELRNTKDGKKSAKGKKQSLKKHRKNCRANLVSMNRLSSQNGRCSEGRQDNENDLRNHLFPLFLFKKVEFAFFQLCLNKI